MSAVVFPFGRYGGCNCAPNTCPYDVWATAPRLRALLAFYTTATPRSPCR